MPKSGAVDICYGFAARKQARHLDRLYNRHLAPTGLSNSQLSILFHLDLHGRLKVAELAEMLVMERTSLVRALKPLQASGLVIAERPERGRSFDVTLSPSGTKKVAEAWPLWKNAQAAFEREVGRARARRLRNVMLEVNPG